MRNKDRVGVRVGAKLHHKPELFFRKWEFDELDTISQNWLNA
jgi:hypothetical protein